MSNDEHLQQHLELCKRIYLRMQADGSWPWKDEEDSQKAESLVESEGKQNNL